MDQGGNSSQIRSLCNKHYLCVICGVCVCVWVTCKRRGGVKKALWNVARCTKPIFHHPPSSYFLLLSFFCTPLNTPCVCSIIQSKPIFLCVVVVCCVFSFSPPLPFFPFPKHLPFLYFSLCSLTLSLSYTRTFYSFNTCWPLNLNTNSSNSL